MILFIIKKKIKTIKYEKMKDNIKVYSENDLIHLMTSIGDKQYLHNPKEMAKLSKLAIIPGVAIQSFALNDILTSMTINCNDCKDTNIKNMWIPEFTSLFNFGLPFSQDDEIKFSYNQETKESARIKAYSPENLENDKLTSGNNHSTFSLGTPIGINPSHFKDYVITGNNIVNYAKSVGITNPSIARMLYTMSFASKVLLDAVEEKDEDIFQEVKAGIQKKHLPTYSSIETHVSRPSEFEYYSPELLTSFGVNAVKEGKRGYKAHLTCNINGHRVYEVEAVLTVVPESIILEKMAKPIK
jgi:hypothetical protein